MTDKNYLITGNSSGLGRAFSESLLQQGGEVYGFSRRGCDITHSNLHDARIDMGDLDQLHAGLSRLLEGVTHLDCVILNAGILGEIEPMQSLDIQRLKKLMDINVWSNKLLLDYLFAQSVRVDQVVAISSGAAVNGNKGWGAYSLSKATLNMLIKLYAAEVPDTHFISLAPGLVDTRMQDYLCDPQQVDEQSFPSVKKLRAARGTEAMPTAQAAAKNMLAGLPRFKNELASGSFVDMRSL